MVPSSAAAPPVQLLLERTLSLLDTLYRGGGCGTQLMVSFGELKMVVDNLVQLHHKKRELVASFIQDSQTWFQKCEDIYTRLFITVHTALDRPQVRTGGSGTTHQPLKPSGVPIDPQCALNLIDPGPVKITLHNDNETLAKFPPSSLYQVVGIASKIEAMEEYFESECTLLHDSYLSSYDLLQDDEAERGEVGDIRRKVVFIKCIMRDLPASKDMSLREELGVSLDSLVESIEKEVATQDKMREACMGHRDNVLAKFMVSVQLKDNMLRSYNLTRAHQKSEYISPIF